MFFTEGPFQNESITKIGCLNLKTNKLLWIKELIGLTNSDCMLSTDEYIALVTLSKILFINSNSGEVFYQLENSKDFFYNAYSCFFYENKFYYTIQKNNDSLIDGYLNITKCLDLRNRITQKISSAQLLCRQSLSKIQT